jgi:hypothetical protein
VTQAVDLSAEVPVAKRKPLTCLMFKLPPEGATGPPVFHTPAADDIAFWQRFGWHLLCTEHDIRYADLDDVRRDDESRGRTTGE